MKHIQISLATVVAAVMVVGGFQAAGQQQPAPTQPAGGPPGGQSQQPSQVELAITGDPGTPPRYAVPDFVALTPDVADMAKMLGQVLWDDLNFEREFYLIPRDTYATVPAARTPEQVPFAAWRELGADAVVFGTVQSIKNNIRVEIRLYNVRSRQSVFSKEYTGTASFPRRYAHTISDEIHQQQRSLRGVALTKLAFVSDRNRERLAGPIDNREVKEVYITDYDGANAQRITVSRQLNLNPAWSADARTVLYTQHRPEPTILASVIYQGILRVLTKDQGSSMTPAYSPDGSRIAFASNRDGNLKIYVMNADGSNVRQLTNHTSAYEVAPTWSPTGSQIAFTSDRSGKAQIYVMGADGSNIRRITTAESEADGATWSPTSNEIAFAARTGAGFDIKIYDLVTQQTRQLTFGEGTNESPAFSPNGRHVAFTSTRAGKVQVFTIGRDGKGLKQITRDGNNQTPAWSN